MKEIQRFEKYDIIRRPPCEEYILYPDHVIALADERARIIRGDFSQICSYCGWEAPKGGATWEEIQAHIRQCPEHPVSALLSALEDCDKAFVSWQLGQIPGRPEDILALINKVRAAIQKARGEK